ncbi:hypothetical protein M513_08509 [Trichuris suis]|uniref:Uncharacterized protein n=1 Tax=Trichuris suis TaxID=68888 RepID=A0A085M014_9BILA|nr:hypothetical protein M513_08509 [Trichuris suis]
MNLIHSYKGAQPTNFDVLDAPENEKMYAITISANA